MLRPLILCLGLAFAAPAPAQTATDTSPAAAPANDQTGFTIITPKGYVSITADSTWGVMAVQSKMPAAVIAFDIPDPYAGGNEPPTNLVINLSDPSTPEGQKAIALTGETVGAKPPAQENYRSWTVYTSDDAEDGGVTYTLMDARADIADVVVGVRLVWPHLAGHPADFDARMRTLLLKELDQISGGLGAYKMPGDATAYRPNP